MICIALVANDLHYTDSPMICITLTRQWLALHRLANDLRYTDSPMICITRSRRLASDSGKELSMNRSFSVIALRCHASFSDSARPNKTFTKIFHKNVNTWRVETRDRRVTQTLRIQRDSREWWSTWLDVATQNSVLFRAFLKIKNRRKLVWVDYSLFCGKRFRCAPALRERQLVTGTERSESEQCLMTLFVRSGFWPVAIFTAPASLRLRIIERMIENQIRFRESIIDSLRIWDSVRHSVTERSEYVPRKLETQEKCQGPVKCQLSSHNVTHIGSHSSIHHSSHN